MKTIIRDLCVRERYSSADSCSGTEIYRLLKGMVLNVVLKSTHENEHEKQAAKVAQEKLLRKPLLFGLSVSRNLKVTGYHVGAWFKNNC